MTSKLNISRKSQRKTQRFKGWRNSCYIFQFST
jgi:hypothetical protein